MNYPQTEKSLSYLISSIVIPLLVGLIASLLTMQSMQQFSTLNKPPLSPPAIIFPIVWTILYTLMGIGFYLVTTSDGEKDDVEKAVKVYWLQLAVNFLWPTFFFNYQWYLFSLFWLVLLWVLVLIMIIRFEKVSKTAAYINIPYMVWLTFAAYLNTAIFLLN